MKPVLRLVPVKERVVVKADAARIAADNREWALARVGVSGPKLCDNLALTVAAIAPGLGVRRLEILVRFSLWTFMFDDRMDDPAADVDALRAVEASVDQALGVGDRAADGGDVLVGTLERLVADLREHDREGVALPRLFDALRDDAAGSLAHALLSRRVAAGAEPLPTVPEYLEFASRSINYRSFALALLLLLGGRSADTLDRLGPALGSACRAIRLANDLRSVERHRREGTLNALLLADPGGAPVTREAVDARVDEQVRLHDGLVGELADTGAGTALVNSLRISVGMYRLGQLR
ncbi:terpene synthase family protein [Longispora sp. NPDC051575]|uniref:terpene synthase family protein n=1 Tax=Longispora sp. NPDC051575 TaxID=3154943 RepID=UPI0034224B89